MQQENSQKKDAAIVLGVTADWAFAAATVLCGIHEHLTKDADVIIFHNGITTADQARLSSIRPVRFIWYDGSRIETEKFAKFSKLAFSRYECFALLREYRTVVWLDADLVIKGNIDYLVSGLSHGIAMQRRETTLQDEFSEPIDGYDMTRPVYNDGVLVLNDTLLDPMRLREWLYRTTNELAAFAAGDQSIVNLMLQEFDLPVHELPDIYNCQPHLFEPDVRIVHATGGYKFWRRGLIDSTWDLYYSRWRAQGGSGPELPHLTLRMIRHTLSAISPALEYAVGVLGNKLRHTIHT